MQESRGRKHPPHQGGETSDSKRRGEKPERQSDRKKYNLEHTVYRNAHNAERQKEQPHERIGDQCYQRQRPAKTKQEAPEQECEHGRPPLPA
jgi:hypothetical protein